MPSSSLFEDVDEVEVKVRAQNYFFGVGGWVVGGEMENEAISSSNLKLKLRLATI